jgi:hypothetical protein
MCPTTLGRIQTRIVTIWGPAIGGLTLSLITGRPDWVVLIGVYLLMGVALDVCVYSWLLRYQPPWMTGVLGLGEFGLLYVLAHVLHLNLSPWEAIFFYWSSWLLVVCTKVVVLPIVSLTYLESSFEFRRAAWSIPPAEAPMPVRAAPAAGGSLGPLLREASVPGHRVLKPLPSPSVERPAEPIHGGTR